MLIVPGAEEAQAAAAAASEESAETETPTTETGGEEQEPESISTPPEPDLQAQLDTEREQRIRLEERLAVQTAPPPPAKEEPPKEFSRVQLRAAVDEGTISQDQMDETLAEYQHNKTMRGVDERMDARDQKRDTANVVQIDTAKYLDAHPDIRTVGTSDWNRLKSEYDYLIGLGHKDNKITELAAMRAAFGSAERIRESTASRRQTSGEMASTQSGTPAGGDRPVDIWNRVPKHLREAFKKMVSDGVMTLEDVKKDIPYMKAHSS